MARAALAVIGLAVVLGAAYYWLAMPGPVPTEQAAAQPRVMAEHHDPAPAEQYCLERSGADGIVFDVGGDCASDDDRANEETLGVTVDADADVVTVTGYDL